MGKDIRDNGGSKRDLALMTLFVRTSLSLSVLLQLQPSLVSILKMNEHSHRIKALSQQRPTRLTLFLLILMSRLELAVKREAERREIPNSKICLLISEE